MSDLEQRVRTLETKVKILEETLETLKNMRTSEQMEDFIKQKKQTLKMVSLINSVADKPSFDFDEEEEAVDHLSQVKRTIDDQIRTALKDAGTFSDDLPGDPRYFNYEVESGMAKNAALNTFAGKGLRITAYNGFETDRVIIPNEIDGQPVISIGEKAFMNATVSEVVLPKSLKAILDGAFKGCSRLRHIDIPNTTEYLGEDCFDDSGIEELVFPIRMTKVPDSCCRNCKQLERVAFGPQVTTIGDYAFSGCTKLRKVSLPDSLLDVNYMSFRDTSICTMIFPRSVKKVSGNTFGNRDISVGRYHARSEREVVCVFLGKDTVVDLINTCISLIYCLPGSKIQQIAREHHIPIKPLSEFRMENYQ